MSEFPPEWHEAAAEVLAADEEREADWSDVVIAKRIVAAVAPLVRADETRRIADDLRTLAADSRSRGLSRTAGYFDFVAELVAARIAHEGGGGA